MIDWHRQIDLEVRVSSEPAETLFVADDRRMADEVLKLAFDFARAAAQLPGESGATASGAGTTPQITPPVIGSRDAQATSYALDDLIKRRDQMQKLLEQLSNENMELQRRRSRDTRDSIAQQVAANQAQIDLVQSRIGSIDNLIDFEKDTAGARGSTLPFEAQIDALEHSVAQANVGISPAPPAAAPSPSVLPGSIERLLALRQKEQALGSAIELTDKLSRSVIRLRQTLVGMLAEIDRQGLSQTAQVGNQDLPTVERTKAQFAALVARSQLISNTLVPLAKEIILLQLYSGNLARWRTSVHQQFNDALRHQLISTISLALVFGAVFAAAGVWRHLTFRYVEDLQHRQKLLQLRRLVVIAAVVLVLVFGFSNQLSSLATVMGFAAAGIALALQNVIISTGGLFLFERPLRHPRR